MYEQLAEVGFSDDAIWQLSLASEGANRAMRMRQRFLHDRLFVKIKPDGSFETLADGAVKRFFIRNWHRRDPGMFFNAENDNTGISELEALCLTRRHCRNVFVFPRVCEFDAIDNTANFIRQEEDWCTAMAVRQFRNTEFSVLVAPDLQDLQCISQRKVGTWYRNGVGGTWQKARVRPWKPGEPIYLAHGDALTDDPRFQFLRESLMNDRENEWKFVEHRCGLNGLTMSAWQYHLFFHGFIRVYDREPGVLAVKEAGGFVQRIRKTPEGFRKVLLDAESCCPGKCTTGVYAGSPSLKAVFEKHLLQVRVKCAYAASAC